jgi:hypothetical protein
MAKHTGKIFIIIHRKLRISNWMFTIFKSIYEGHLPVLVTSDLNLLEEVFNKQFRNFIARRVCVYNEKFSIKYIKKSIISSLLHKRNFHFNRTIMAQNVMFLCRREHSGND